MRLRRVSTSERVAARSTTCGHTAKTRRRAPLGSLFYRAYACVPSQATHLPPRFVSPLVDGCAMRAAIVPLAKLPFQVLVPEGVRVGLDPDRFNAHSALLFTLLCDGPSYYGSQWALDARLRVKTRAIEDRRFVSLV